MAYWTVIDEHASDDQHALMSQQIDHMRGDLARQLGAGGIPVRSIAHPDEALFGLRRHLLSVMYVRAHADRLANKTEYRVALQYEFFDPNFVSVFEEETEGYSLRGLREAARLAHGRIVERVQQHLNRAAP